MRSRKRFIAALAGAALVLCQSLGLVQASLAAPAQPAAGESVHPCHGTPHDSTPQDNHAGACHFASPAASELPVVAALPLPAISFRQDDAVAAMPIAYAEPLLQRIEPPPHHILHCCLRN